jgi:putative DNA methylase
MTYRKKLIEVALPLEAISDACAVERDIHTGLPANLHTWWSRKPLAASRAVIFASMIDDPGTDPRFSKDEVENERTRLFNIIRHIVYPTNMTDEDMFDVVYGEILKATDNVPPPFFDPFAGGGSIPLEAMRLGLEVYASDLNPVSVIINKAMIESASRFLNCPPINPSDSEKLLANTEWTGLSGLIADIEYYGNWMLERARRQIGALYPKGPNDEEVIAWIWVRTVKCKNPACGAQMPLAKKFWVSTHRGNEAWVNPVVNTTSRTVRFDIVREGVPPKGTITNTGANCIVCNTPVPFSYIRDMGRAGKMDCTLTCIVVDGSYGREYLPPNDDHVAIANSANPSWVPETSLPERALGFRVQAYGITKHRDLFTSRQLAAITTFADLIDKAHRQVVRDSGGSSEYADAIATFLALAVDRLAQTNNTLVRWLVRKSGTSKGTPAFDRQVVSMVWEFSEGNVTGKSVGSWHMALKNVLSAFKSFPLSKKAAAQVLQHDATVKPSFLQRAPIISTDPPYFDNIGYADLSDFYYTWLRKTLGKIYPDVFGTLLTPKQTELTAADHLYNGDQAAAEEHFLGGIERAFKVLASLADPGYPITIYYAFRETERFSITWNV